jgi:hypothetical protein
MGEPDMTGKIFAIGNDSQLQALTDQRYEGSLGP